MANIHVVIKQKKEKMHNFSKQFNRLGKIIASKNRMMSSLGLEVSKLKRMVNANNSKSHVKDLSRKIARIKIAPKVIALKQDDSALKKILAQNNRNIMGAINRRPVIKKEEKNVTLRPVVHHTIREKLALPQITIINKGGGVIPFTG